MSERLSEKSLKEYRRMVDGFIGDSRGGPAAHITALMSHIEAQDALLADIAEMLDDKDLHYAGRVANVQLALALYAAKGK